jgi:hypothetical protein
MLHVSDYVLFMYQLDDNKGQEPHESHSYPGPDDYLMYCLVKICGLGFVFVSVCYPNASDVYCNFFYVPCSASHMVGHLFLHVYKTCA